MTDNSEKKFLDNYDMEKYERPSVAADIIIFSIYEEENSNQRKIAGNKLSVLMIRRNEHPYKDCWALPGGFWRKDETMEECALRELEEETGLTGAKLLYVGAFSKPGRDPRGWILSNAFMAPVERARTMIKAGYDAAEAAWFSLDADYDSDTGIWKLTLESQEREDKVILNATVLQKKGLCNTIEYEQQSSDGVAFDHGEILARSLVSLRKHLITDDIAYEFLPDKFTIIQLQKVHEIVLEQELIAPNFRRKIAAEIEETGEMLEGKAFRPAMLYKHKEQEMR